MTRISTAAVLSAALLSASSTFAAAHDTTPIERELARQGRMIEAGRMSGELTPGEARMLEGEQSRIAWMLRAARYDGNVTKREFNAICDAQEAAARSIAFESTDADVSRWRKWSKRRDTWDRDDGYGSGRDWGRDWGYGRWGYGRWDYGRWGYGAGRHERGAY